MRFSIIAKSLKSDIMSKYIIPIFLSIVLFSACTDVIDVDLDEGESVLSVDAFLNNLPGPQVIKLRFTAPYFSNEFTPEASGATVTVDGNDGNTYNFVEVGQTGDYVWSPGPDSIFGTIGADYTLTIVLDGQTYTAVSRMNPVPPIDSISTEFREDEFGQPDGYYAQFHSTDLPGRGNTYWIKAFKNGMFLNKPQEMNLAFDATFTGGVNTDAVPFIQPIAEGINRIPDTGDDAVDDSDLPPYELGDSIRVELHAITEETFYFLEEVRTQTTLGDAGIFAEPATNVPTNIIPVDNEDENTQGFFSVAAVAVAETIVEE